jgi:hypothetical protein
VTIIPHALSDDLDPDVEAGAREAFEDALEDPQPGVRALAARELARFRAHDLRGHELQGRMLLLRRQTGDSWTTLLPPGTTDRRGRARFSRVRGDSRYSLEVRSAGLPRRAAMSTGWAGQAVAAGREEAAAPSWGLVEDALARLCALRLATYDLSDRRLTAVLRELPRGGAALTICSQAAELAGAGVRFRIGDETGEVPLSADPSGAAMGSVALKSPYREVEVQIPSFEVVALRQG